MNFSSVFPVFGLSIILISSSLAAEAARWVIPFGGNSYLTESTGRSPDRIEPKGVRKWEDGKSVFSIWFRADRAATLSLGLRLSGTEGGASVRVSVAGKSFEKDISGTETREADLGVVDIKAPGYVRLDLQGISKIGEIFADVDDLLVSSQTPGLELNYVKDNERGNFYWGRRGPSVHLPYEVPSGKTIEWFYSEFTVPEGQDPIGSYFMANGFGEGYFGIQVNSEKERRVLFSVWSPFTTDNPKEIPDDQRVKLLAKGENVHGGEFGGEGSGGQSYLVYPWKAGTTYRFLNRARPDGKGNTIYTAWFHAPEAARWQLIASFLRPKTDKYLTGLHSFLENLAERNGYQRRGSLHGNQWIRDTDGDWTELTKTRFTGDAIARSKFRRDYAGGVLKDKFFMSNGGFFAENVELGKRFERESTGRPEIDLKELEASE